MEHIAVFEEQVPLTPKDMRRTIESIDKELEAKLREKLEGRCSRHGFVLADTIRLLSRSMGMLEKGRFTGNILFQVQAEGKVLNPPDGTVVEGEVIRKNKMGMYVNYKDAIKIIVPRDLHIGNDLFESVELGEIVKVEIKKSRFQVNDENILSVGLLLSSVRKGKPTAPAPVAAAGVAEEGGDEDEEEDAEEEGEEDAEEGDEEGDEEQGLPPDLPNLVPDPALVGQGPAKVVKPAEMGEMETLD
jgi:DNA-directed RNA polymerase subunit E'/Rpb7